MNTHPAVPLLSDLPQEQLAAVCIKHRGYCHRHADLSEPQLGSTTPDMQHERFICSVCGKSQMFNLLANDTHSLDRYICEFLRQGVKFNRRHARCVVPQ